MEFQRQSIREQIIENGWEITEFEKHELGWWANEMWQLESVWSPLGETAFVTFLLEPENMEYVWGIMVSKEKPSNQFGHFILSLKGWEKELPEFIKHLSEVRNQ